MKDPLFAHFFSNWKRLIKKDDVCLIALSGGIDSMALYVLAKEAVALYGGSTIPVHVDHNVREESAEQATILHQQTGAEILRLDTPEPTRDKENILRERRYRALAQAYERHSATTLLTGHHAGDQVETVLKRIFEGASLQKIAGIQEVTCLYGMTVKRPLLSVQKEDLAVYLKERGITHLEDPSNTDRAFTRNRIRHEIIPFLERSFGKNICKNIVSVAEEARIYTSVSVSEKNMSLDALNQLDEAMLHMHIANHYAGLTRSERATLRMLIRNNRIGKKVQGITVRKEGLVEK